VHSLRDCQHRTVHRGNTDPRCHANVFDGCRITGLGRSTIPLDTAEGTSASSKWLLARSRMPSCQIRLSVNRVDGSVSSWCFVWNFCGMPKNSTECCMAVLCIPLHTTAYCIQYKIVLLASFQRQDIRPCNSNSRDLLHHGTDICYHRFRGFTFPGWKFPANGDNTKDMKKLNEVDWIGILFPASKCTCLWRHQYACLSKSVALNFYCSFYQVQGRYSTLVTEIGQITISSTYNTVLLDPSTKLLATLLLLSSYSGVAE